MKILMIGLGSIGQRHLRNIRSLYGDRVEILAYRARGLKQTFTDKLEIREGVDLEQEYHIRSFTDLDEALAEKPDIAFITNITSEHIPCAIKAAAAGCDLFLEKPLANNMDGIDELERLVQKNQLVVSVGFQNRYHVCLQRTKELLSQNIIGDILSVHVEMGERLTTMHAYEDYRTTYIARHDMGGGVVTNQLIHELDYIMWLFGMPSTVFSIGGHLSPLEIDVEDVTSALLNIIKDGKPLPVSVHADFIQHPPVRQCKIVGTSGSIQFKLYQPELILQLHDQPAQVETFTTFNRNDMFIAEIKDFFAAVESRSLPPITLKDGIMSLKLALAINQSNSSGKLVSLDT